MSTWALPPLPARFSATDGAFVGRRTEVELLEAVWTHVESGAGQAVLIGGAAGQGKSRLAAEVARAVHAQGAVVLFGACSPDLDRPYSPFADALDQLLLGTGPGELAHLLPATAGQLARLTPHLTRHGVEPTRPSPSETEHRRDLFDAYASLLASVAGQRPVVLILDDLHWASGTTRLLLDHLLRSCADVPLLILATLRDTGADRSDELTTLVADAYRLPHVHRIDLVGLGTSDIAAYLVASGGVELDRVGEAAALLEEQTGGNPFFLRELWRDLARQGGLTGLRSGEVTAPRTVRDTLSTRLRAFDPAERECLELAAVLGGAFDVGDVAAAGGHSREQVLQALDRAGDHGLLGDDQASGRFTFEHALVRQALLDGLSPSRSAALHARLAEALAPRLASQPELTPLLARLYDGAAALGYDDERVDLLTAAAAQSQRTLAHEEAARLWERAARVRPADRTRAEQLLLAAADSHSLAGDFDDARRLCREVTSSSDDRTVLRAAIGYENASWRPGLGGQEPLELLTAALERVQPDPADPLYIRGLASRGRALAFSGELAEARRVGSRALALAREVADRSLVADALMASLLQMMATPGSIAVHHQRAIELRQIAVESRDYDKLGPAGSYRALTSYMAGNREGWKAGRADIQLTASKTGQPFWQWVAGCYEHCSAFMAGDFVAAEASAERNRRIGSSFGSDDTDGPYGIQMFLLRRETGQLERARPLISADGAEEQAWRPGLLAMYTELGMGEQASRLLEALLDGLSEADRATAVWPAVVVFLAQAAIGLADDAALRAVEPLVAEYDGLNIAVGQCVAVLGSANLLLAQIRALRGDDDGAERHFQRALTADRRMRSSVHEAETLARFAAFLLRRDRPGDRERAGEHRRAARALAEPRGHRRVLDLLDDRRAWPQLPDDLTHRELDVLRLLAEGASNKAIGRRLHISQNTAANHVRSILMKTGSSNRTQAALYATDRGLVTAGTGPRGSRQAGPGWRSR